MSRALLLVVLVCGLVLGHGRGAEGQSFIEEAVTGLLGRTAKMGHNIVDLASGGNNNRRKGSSHDILDQGRGSAGLFLRPDDGTVAGGLFRGFMRDVDDTGNLNKGTLLNPEQHQMIGGLLGGLFNGAATTPKPFEERPGILESLSRRHQENRSERQRGPARAAPSSTREAEHGDEDVAGLIEMAVRRRGAGVSATRRDSRVLPPAPVDGLIDEFPVIPTPAREVGLVTIGDLASKNADDRDDDKLSPPVLGDLDALRRDVARDAPECSNKAKAQLSKVLGNFRKGVLDCVGVEDADLSDVLNRLRQVLLIADRLPTSLVHNLNRCVSQRSIQKSRQNATMPQESAYITKIPSKHSTGGDPSEVSSARCIIQALADSRDRLHKIPTQAAAFSRRVAFLLAGTKSDARVRACVASQLTAMAHPLVATTRQLAGCVLVGPEFTPE